MKKLIDKGKVHAHRLLRKSEKYTKTDMVYLARGSFWTTFGQSVSMLLSLLLVIAFANLLPKETYGTYKYILSLAGVLNIFTLTGMNSAVSRAVAQGNEGSLIISVKYQLKWNLLMFLGFLALGVYYLINGDRMFAVSFFILGVFVPATLAFNTYGAYLGGKKEFRIASVSNILSTIVYSIGVFLAIILSGKIEWLITAYAITSFVTTLYFYLYILRKFKPSPASNYDFLKYGRELSFIGFLGPITTQLDKIILAHFWGPAQLAVYSLALAVPERATSLMKNWVGIGFPKFSEKTSMEINTVFYKRISQGMFVGTAIAFAYILISPYLFRYLLPQYLESLLYSQILAISFIFAIPNRYTGLLFVSQKMTRVIFIKSIIQNIVRIILYVILGIIGGILGLIIANLACNILGLIINMIFWRKNTIK